LGAWGLWVASIYLPIAASLKNRAQHKAVVIQWIHVSRRLTCQQRIYSHRESQLSAISWNNSHVLRRA